MPSYVTDANLNSYQLAFCGAVAGVVSRFVVAPLDVVKIRMQLQNHRTDFSFRNVGLHSETSIDNHPIKYSGVLRSLKTILKEEGIKGWYKGNIPAEYLYLSYSAIEFWTYKELESWIDIEDKEQKMPRVMKTFVSGMVAGSVATTATYPFDLLRTRFAVQGRTRLYTGVFQAMRSIYAMEGIQGFYPGIRPALIQIMPYMGLLFATYDGLAMAFKKMRDEGLVSTQYKATHDMLSGALSGIISKTAVYPIDVVRKRLQVQGPYLTNYVIQPTKYSSASWSQCMKLIAKQEGFKSLYKGLVPSLVKIAPANAVTFLVFEETKKLLVSL
ncbi:mitochondrial carrier domain-containing protein [Halteromyces radiatus]|uniref:mitochondrial carrier domain-containing protein n=1 Tax=Halteromyces radiatus TaxID=101107 RepID=UPI0022202CF3|nr:mitochondrial carrier domain-containing protein [Halteromyces radiatus]KAI8089116.1 mitochondrial carrier domain-containing protein [Halteromyces radiatus]